MFLTCTTTSGSCSHELPCIILQGKKHYTVDSGIMNFCNHGCNGTYNYGVENEDELIFNEMDVALDHIPEALQNTALVYSPVLERHLRQVSSIGDYALKDIRKGEEILCNYLACEYIHTLSVADESPSITVA